ncbi:MAG: aspartate dehydrogenase [Methanosarcinaceae archaeon]|nr:aspartate dehydrogenase [Methanosarcinaceae archaeon]MDF1534032.1 aspartate dehydrogenase [Methanosarcinaceae archaeon]
MFKIGVVGCGAIGAEICKAIDEGSMNIELYAIYDRNDEHTASVKIKLKNMNPQILDIAEMAQHVDLIVEAASQMAVPEVALTALNAGCDVMIMSIGAFADEKLRDTIFGLAKEKACKVYLPSGAIVGLDGLKSAMSAEVYSITLTTQKPPLGLAGAPYIIQNNIDLDKITSRTVIFEGTANEAVKAFPANVNVAASLSIAGIGFERTKVRIVADPVLTTNVHEISVEGEFGKFNTKVENVPSPTNPKTSYLAALSAIATIKKIANPVQIGT